MTICNKSLIYIILGSCSKTRLTRSKILDPNTNTWTEEAYTYDAYGRVKSKCIYIPELAQTKKIQYIYDAAGKLLKQSYQPQDANESLYQWFKYDAAGRLDTLFTNRTNNFFTARREAVYDYDDNHGGKVKRMELGGTVQGVDYTYTIRDWLKMINHQNINPNDDPGQDGKAGGPHANFTVDRFGMVLSYHESEHGTNIDNSSEQYNGNIRSIIWNSGQGLAGYGFTYDNANRLVNANYKEYLGGSWNATQKYSEKSLQYDANGNILSLTRHLNSSTGSALNYTYDANKPNRLNKVTGLINAVYEYDHNGNMTRDTTKGYFAYDYRNMPLKVTRNDTTIEYAYDAGGQRTKKTIKKNNLIIDQSIYIRNGSNVIAEYKNNNLDHFNIYGNDLIGKLKIVPKTIIINNQILNNVNITARDTVEIRAGSQILSESFIGTVSGSQAADKRFYYVTDHLGSIRVVLKEDGNVESWSDYYPFGKESRGSSTSNEPKEQFSGKLFDDEIGLNYFGARYYNPTIGRFTKIDRFTVKYPSLSGYQYAANNPLRFIDYNGDDIEIANDEDPKEKIEYKNGKIYWKGTNNEYFGKARRTGKGWFGNDGKLAKFFDGDFKGFVGDAFKALSKIESGGGKAGQLISDLVNSSETTTIDHYSKSTSLDNAGNPQQSYDPSSGTVYWNPSQGQMYLGENNKLVETPSFVSMAHELKHAHNKVTGSYDSDPWYINHRGNTIINDEKSAGAFENIVRGQHNIGYRAYYDVIQTSNGYTGEGPLDIPK